MEKINFLLSEKTTDWRFKVYQDFSLHLLKGEQKTIYWIGIVNLRFLKDASDKNICVSFVPMNSEKEETDTEKRRGSDGSESGGISVISYIFEKEVVEEFLRAKKGGWKYFHVFLKESVDNTGRHIVSLIYNRKSPHVGIRSKKPWVKEESGKWAPYSFVEISEEFSEKIILRHGPYSFIK